jgi:SAM-dependent methyltransferase
MLELLRGPADATTREDHVFDEHFPTAVRRLSAVHWTPVAVARRAAQLLVESAATTVLDVGAGVGKFCIIGARTTPGRFVGVERHGLFAKVARNVVRRRRVPRVEIVRGEALALDWRRFDAIYLFNPFDDPVPNEPAIRAAEKKLLELRPGARVVTYHGFGGVMPSGFRRVVSEPSGTDRLELFVRTTSSDEPERGALLAKENATKCNQTSS